MSVELKRRLSIAINFLIFVFAALGVTLACVNATRDGYSHWYKRLWYFTQQSNIWIALSSFAFLISESRLKERLSDFIRFAVYTLKFIFTVSITVTGIIFCSLLAPFAEFNIWHLSSVLTHIAVPLLAIFDLFFLNRGEFILRSKQALLSLSPPIFYFIFAGTLCLFKVDFGRGDPFPYFFMDFYSEVGMFGFEFDGLPQLGAFYWIVIFIGLILGLSFLYLKLCNFTANRLINKASPIQDARQNETEIL